jgi:hypothetical protein
LEALRARQVLDRGHRAALWLEVLAMVAGQAGQGARAARLLGAGATLLERIGSSPGEHEQPAFDAAAAARAALGEDAWAAAFAAGRALTLEEAIADGEDPTSPSEGTA